MKLNSLSSQIRINKKIKSEKDMKAIRYIGQALRRMATALLTALFGAILWAGASEAV